MAITINDIAKKAGVSLATVSRVLNKSGYVKKETKERILKVIEELNYSPSAIARSLSKNKTNTIGVIVPQINNPFFAEIIKGVSKIADEHDLNIILCDTDDSLNKEMKALRLLKEQRIQGILITPTSVEDEFNSEYLNIIESFGIPIILIDGHVKCSTFSGVFVNNIKAAYESVSTFIKAGHKKIGIITGRMNSKPAQDRLIGYKKALKMNHLPFNENYVFYGDYQQDTAYKITKGIINMEDKPTAMLLCSNMTTLGCLKAFFECNIKIPKDMAIIGFDRIDVLEIVGLNISYVDGPTIDMGKLAMKMLIDNIKNNNKEVKRVTLMPELVLKGSEVYYNR
ncbi:LacI family DNA-binding transcriptional regulator [Clostridium rectalis]|uniref:LacI family DNA-binding transcriptional regulator n=1 Tax=Clostridium rectalis TaxID=2040295 RepID=UPI000F63BB7D|nr:LacI family DNA-binding transcriptional regulator [Clostridium rectalis]